MIGFLRECTDVEYIYGILQVKDKTTEEVQNKINEIKNKFWDDGISDWTIEDVIQGFPDDWEINYKTDITDLTI